MRSISVDPQRFEELLTYCVNFAKQMLHSHGAFHPFGATLGADGKVGAVGGYTGEEHPKGAELFLLLQGAMKAQFTEKKILAAAIAADVNIPRQYQSPYPDGVRVLLEASGYSRFIYLPYRVSKPGFLARLSKAGFKCDFGAFISVDVHPTICAEATNG